MTTFLTALFWTSVALVAYHLVGYVAVLRLVSALRGRRDLRRPQNTADWPTVSLIIPAHNEAGVIADTLRSVAGLDYPPDRLEVIVVDDGSTDGTAERARQACDGKRLRVLEVRPRQGKPNALAEGSRVARGDVLCFMDANVTPKADSLRALVAALSSDRIGAASAFVHLRNEGTDLHIGESIYYGVEHRLHGLETRTGSALSVDGSMYVVRRSLYQPLPKDTILDDFVTSMNVVRQGKDVVFVPGATASEAGTESLADEWKRKKRLAAGSFQSLWRRAFPPLSRPVLLWQFVSHKLLRWLLPWLLVVIVVTGFALRDRSPVYWLASLLIVAAAALGLAGVLIRPLRRVPPFGLLAYALVSLTAFALGPLLAFRQGVLWEKASRAGVDEKRSAATLTPEAHVSVE